MPKWIFQKISRDQQGDRVISIFNSLLLINMINSCHHSKFQNFPTLNLVLTLERAIFISSCVHRPWRVGRAWACYHTFWQPKKQEKIQDSIVSSTKLKLSIYFFFHKTIFGVFLIKRNFQICTGFCDLIVVQNSIYWFNEILIICKPSLIVKLSANFIIKGLNRYWK